MKRWLSLGLAMALALSLLLGSVVFGGTTVAWAAKKKAKAKPTAAQTVLSQMSTKQKVELMLMPAYRNWGSGKEAVGVTSLNEAQKASLRSHNFGGVILFADNIKTSAQTQALVRELQKTNLEGGALSKLFISVDQEGGQVSRMTTGTQMPGNMALGATNNDQLVMESASVMGAELAALGMNVDFAPVLDVNNNPANPVIGVRSFSDDPNRVARFGKAFIDGIHTQNVMTSLKHFPGHGDTATDSHTGLPCINKTLDQLMQNELIPYAANLQYTDMVMTAHIQYPMIETQTYTSKATGEQITLPATLSRTIITGLLRNNLGYNGIVITDAMNMDAIAKHFDRKDAARLAINAGVDMMLMPVDLSTPEGLSSMDSYVAEIVAMTQDGTIPASRIDEAALRILNLKEKYGMLTMTEAAVTQTGDASIVGSKAHHDIETKIAERAITLLKNDNGAIEGAKSGKAVICVPFSSESNSALYAVSQMKAKGTITQDPVILSYDGLTPKEAADVANMGDTVIAVSALSKLSALDPTSKDGASAAFLDALIKAAHEKNKKVIVISGQLPYDAARYQSADAILCAYNSKGMNKIPWTFEGETESYGPNIPAAIRVAFGDVTPTGTLPVNIPKLDSNWQITNEILYPRGQ